MASELAAMTGMSVDEASVFLDMAGGSMEVAVDLYFNTSASQEQESSMGEGNQWHSCSKLLWSGTLNEAWLMQGISFSSTPGEEIGIIQHKNGPCGVLAVIQALLLAFRSSSGSLSIDITSPFSNEELVHCLTKIVERCAENKEKIPLCSWESDVNDRKLRIEYCNRENIEATLHQRLDQYKQAGGVLLLLFSCVLSRGEENVTRDALAFGELPLLYGPHLLCTSELLMLLLTGKANGAVGAYRPDGNKRLGDLSVLGGVGLLSYQEFETGIPVHDTLKSPQVSVWLLHSGDHFTVLFQKDKNSSTPPLQLYHWNGLPPGGPRLACIEVQGEKTITSAPPVSKETYCKPIAGEIEDIVQASAEDKAKHPENWQAWRYEIVLAVEDDNISGPARSLEENPPHVFEQGQPDEADWRCSSCYRTRFSTMCFGSNPAGTSICQHCQKNREECGWTIWLSYSSLPKRWQKAMDRRYAPKLISILHTKWPEAKVSLLQSTTNSTALPSV